MVAHAQAITTNHPNPKGSKGGTMGRLDGKVAVITGAGTGVGRATMVLFAREGANVVGASRTQSNLDETLQLVEKEGGRGVVVAADLSTEEGARRLIETAVESYGGIDGLVNCAGVGWSFGVAQPGTMAPLDQTTPDQWQEVVNINLGAVFRCSRLAIP